MTRGSFTKRAEGRGQRVESPSALCPLPSTLYPLPSALYPLPSALYPLPSALPVSGLTFAPVSGFGLTIESSLGTRPFRAESGFGIGGEVVADCCWGGADSVV